MTVRRPRIGLALSLILILAATACAPSRSIHRGSWPDGRIMVQQARPAAIATATVEPVEAPVDIGWQPADPGLTAADLNRMGVLQAVYYDYNSSRLGPDQMAALDQNLAWMMENPDADIVVEGHADERGTRRYNLALGQRRAEAARDYLISRGVDPRRIEVVSYGEELPAQRGANETAWSANRRSEFVIVATGR